MFGTIRKHQKWLWIVIIAVMSVSLVVFFTNSPNQQASRKLAGELGTIKGKPVTQEQFLDARREVFLFYYLNNHRWPGNEDGMDKSLQRETLFRLFMTQKLKDLDIHVSEKAVGLYMNQLIGDTPRDRFETEVLAQAGLRWEDFDRFCRHQVAIQQLLAVAGLGGKFVNPKEAEAVLRKDSEELNVQLAVFWASNYLDKVKATPDEVGTFFTNRVKFMSMYHVPERVQVSHVAFPATNFFVEADAELGKITNLNARLDEAYLRLGGTNYFKNADGKPLSEAEAKQKMKDEERHRLALIGARRAANDFGNQLAEQPEPNKLANFEKLAQEKRLPVQVTPPFDRATGLDDTNFPPAFEEAAFKLTTNEPIHFRPIVGDNAVYLIAYNKNIPSEPPLLDKVREKVTADYKLDRASEMARIRGTYFTNTAVIGLAQGKSFADLCAQTNATMISLPPISSDPASLTNLDKRLRLDEPEQPWMRGEPRVRILFDLKPGECSRFVGTRDGGWVAYLKSRTPVSEAKLKEELPKFLASMRYYRYVEAFNKWLGKQAETQLSMPREPTNAPPPRAPTPTARPVSVPPQATPKAATPPAAAPQAPPPSTTPAPAAPPPAKK
jgi:hypothetical protein